MNKFLSRISGPLLITSILALGALAFPVHADAAAGPLIVFRAQSGVLPMQVANNDSEGTGAGTGTGAETSPGGGEEGTGDGSGDGGEAGGGSDDDGMGSESQAIPHVIFGLSDGSIYECQSNDGYEAAYGMTPEQIVAALSGRYVFINDDEGRARVTLQDYMDPARPWKSFDWAFMDGRLHAPRAGCDYGAGYPDSNAWTSSVDVSGVSHPIPAAGTQLKILFAVVERKEPYTP